MNRSHFGIVIVTLALLISAACEGGDDRRMFVPGPELGVTQVIPSPGPAGPTVTATETPTQAPTPTATIEPTTAPATQLPIPIPHTIFDESWRAPVYYFETERVIDLPFSIKAPPRSTIRARLRYEKIIGTLTTRSTRIEFDTGPFGTFLSTPERELQHWQEEINGRTFEFWRTIDDITLFSQVPDVLGAATGEHLSRLDLRAEFNSPQELELILAIIRTIQ
ncbi:MAG: hypothetical protein J4N80_07810 [Chloroflexi bacterium]|nr:hypothetical protein [Chloroflexota bacterium]